MNNTVEEKKRESLCLKAPTLYSNKIDKPLRVVCVSDTHEKHNDVLHKIPAGDILLHCGDFSKHMPESRFAQLCKDLDTFFAALPHKHKFLCAGNHEEAFANHTAQEIQALFPHVTYLQDKKVEVEKLTIYGTGYSPSAEAHAKHWSKIPEHVDILMSHIPPFNVLDLAWEPDAQSREACNVCGNIHPAYEHWGSKNLKQKVKAVAPLTHVFGHVHDDPGFLVQDGVCFINAAVDISKKPIYFDILPVPLSK